MQRKEDSRYCTQTEKQCIKLEIKKNKIFYFYIYVFLWTCTLTEVFPCFFLSCKGKCQGIPRKDGARSALQLISELCCSTYCLCRLCCSMYCLCVNVYCTTATGCQPNCSQQIYHIAYQSVPEIAYIIYHINRCLKLHKLEIALFEECLQSASLTSVSF